MKEKYNQIKQDIILLFFPQKIKVSNEMTEDQKKYIRKKCGKEKWNFMRS